MHKRSYIRRLFFLITVLVLTMVSVGLLSSNRTSAFANDYRFPCDNFGISGYGFGTYVSGWGYHVGEDSCGGGAGRAIYAVAEGTVVYSARTPDSYRWGNLILIEHTNPDGSRVVSLYGHLGNNRQVGAGQVVGKGQLIGFTGPSYTAENGNWAAHLHFGMHPGGYGTATGVYASWVHGYEGSFPAGWASPSAYVRDRMIARDYALIDFPGITDLGFTEKKSIAFKVRNTTNFTWQTEGATPVQLGTVNPLNRGSGFSWNGSGGLNPGWVGTNRIKLQSTTAPGAIATFTATFAGNQNTGRFPECFAVVQEGVRWLGGEWMCPILNVSPASYRAQLYAQGTYATASPTGLGQQMPPNYLVPGKVFNTKLFYKNIGEYAWDTTGPNPVRLGATRPNERGSGFNVIGNPDIPSSENWLAAYRPSEVDGRYDPASNTIVPDDQITNGEIAVFSFATRAPDAAGLLPEYFNPLVEGIGYMNDTGAWLPYRVAPPGDHYQFISQSVPASVGRTTTVVNGAIQVRNTGRTTWPVGGDIRLTTDRPAASNSPFYTATGSDAWIAPNKLSSIDANATVSGKTTVEPGEMAVFNVPFTVPPVNIGTYQAWLRPYRENVGFLPEDYGVWLPIKVTVGPYDYRLEAQTYSKSPGTLMLGDTTSGSLAVRNLGRAPWPVGGPNPVRLATAHPVERGSLFASLAGIDAWPTPTRASAIDGRVTSTSSMSSTTASVIQPNEVALFKIPFTANAPAGNYTEYFNLVHEGIAWLPDKSLSIPLTVVPTGTLPEPSPDGPVSWTKNGNLFSSCTVTGTAGASCSTNAEDHSVYSAWNYKASYQTTPLASGRYNFTVYYGNVGGDLPDNYDYQVKLKVGNNSTVTVTLPGDQTEATFSVQMPSSSTTISLEWINDAWVPNQYDANLGITAVELSK